MQFITGLFGGGGNTILTMIFALGIVIALIVLAVWLLKLLSNVTGNAARGRNRRLAIVDTLAVDQKRQLVIIRRDDVEHLILTGGPQDLVVETGIAVTEQPTAQPARRPVPAVGGRKPAETRQAPPVTAPIPAPEPVQAQAHLPEAAPGTLLEQLRQSGHSGDRKARVSLRHTGLLRPVTMQDPTVSVQNPDDRDGQSPDSAKESENDKASQGKALEHQSSDEANRN